MLSPLSCESERGLSPGLMLLARADFIFSYMARNTFSQCKRSGLILNPPELLCVHIYECLQCSSFWDELVSTCLGVNSFTGVLEFYWHYNDYLRQSEVSVYPALTDGLQNLKPWRNFLPTPLVIEASLWPLFFRERDPTCWIFMHPWKNDKLTVLIRIFTGSNHLYHVPIIFAGGVKLVERV